MKCLADGARVQFGVDVEGHYCLRVARSSTNSRDTVVLGLVEGGDCEGLVEQLRVSR